METVNEPRLFSRRYQVTHLIARGGMAMVYRAQDTLLNRAVALKILYPELSEDPLFVERFRREAQAAANLSHPNIVPVFDWGEDDGTYFIVMELVDGTSLAELLKNGATLSPARSAQIVAQVAAALAYAHRSGVVHRDVKPGNILITRDGQVKVTDFGIAQAVSSEDQLAEAGSVMGTATYFSPEQAEGVAVDGRSDVYSLGVVLYEMVVGRPPYVGDTPVEVSSQHVHSTIPRPSEFSSSVPHDLEAIILEALGKAPQQRYQSADELRADLLRFSEGQPVRAAKGDVAFFGADATQAVAAVAGERTQAVPIMQGPRTDIRRRRRRGGGGWAGFAVTLVIVIVAAAAFAYYEHNKTTVSSMPDLAGDSAAVATKLLHNDGFLVTTNYVKSSKAKNTVVSTFPKVGSRLVKGQSVTLDLSKGVTSTPVTVRDYVGLSLADAESEIEGAGLAFQPQFTSNVPSSGNADPNTVLSQSPPPGTKDQTGDKITLTVLAPGTKYPVAQVSADTVGAATATLTNQGLVVKTSSTTVCSNTIHQGLVVSTVPAAGALVTSGSSVALVLSSGYCQVVVPSVVGDSESVATSLIEGAGLQASFTPDPTGFCAAGASPTVDSQSVAGGSYATYGSTIDLLVCQANNFATTTTSPSPPTS